MNFVTDAEIENEILRAQNKALYEALKEAADAMEAGVRWCNYCGHPDDAGAFPMLHSSTCWVPAARAALRLVDGPASFYPADLSSDEMAEKANNG